MGLEEIIEDMRSQGSGDLDLSFSVDREAARRLRVLPSPAEDGLVALANAVSRGARKVTVSGDNSRCTLNYQNTQVPLGPGALSAIIRRGNFAPLELTVNGFALGHKRLPSLAESRLSLEGELLGGSIALLPAHQVGQVVLVDRGVSFRLGPLFGATRVIAKVTPRQAAPWPSNLTLNTSLKQLLKSLLMECQKLENRAARQAVGRPQLRSRLLASVQRRQRHGDRVGASHLLRLLLQNSGPLKKISG